MFLNNIFFIKLIEFNENSKENSLYYNRNTYSNISTHSSQILRCQLVYENFERTIAKILKILYRNLFSLQAYHF